MEVKIVRWTGCDTPGGGSDMAIDSGNKEKER